MEVLKGGSRIKRFCQSVGRQYHPSGESKKIKFLKATDLRSLKFREQNNHVQIHPFLNGTLSQNMAKSCSDMIWCLRKH